jgi:arylsulfatase
MPTCVELAGATYPKEYQGNAIQPMEGKSLVPVLQGKSLGERELFWKYTSFESAHVGDWKMTRQAGNAWQLFNLAKDPSEMDNLAASNPEKVKTLEVKWQAWADLVNVGKKDKKKGKERTGEVPEVKGEE